MVDSRGRLIAKLSMDPHSPDMAVSSVVSASYKAIDVKADMTTAVQTARLTTSQRKLAVDSDTLARRWGIPSHKAKRTVQHTTQCGVRNIANPTLVQ